jgi:hypothetical protein
MALEGLKDMESVSISMVLGLYIHGMSLSIPYIRSNLDLHCYWLARVGLCMQMNGVRLNTCMHFRREHALSHTRAHMRRLNYCGWPVPRNFFCRAVMTGCSLPEWRATARCSEPLLFDSGPARNLITTVKNYFIRHTTHVIYHICISNCSILALPTISTHNKEDRIVLLKGTDT